MKGGWDSTGVGVCAGVSNKIEYVYFNKDSDSTSIYMNVQRIIK